MIRAVGVTRHKSSKVATVHGYDVTDKAQNDPSKPPGASVRSFVDQGTRAAMGLVPPGVYPLLDPKAGLVGGTTTLRQFPEGEQPSKVRVRWRTSIIPLKGAYRIPN